MIKSYLLIIFLFITLSCGLRVSEEKRENPLIGTWSLTEYNCSDLFIDAVGKEIYQMTDAAVITISFVGSRISYNSVGVCTTSSQGSYSIEYNESESGLIDITNVITGGTTCTEDVVDRGDDLVGTISVPTTMDGRDTEDREWFISNNVLYIENFTNFYGSPSGGICNGACICRGTFTKN